MLMLQQSSVERTFGLKRKNLQSFSRSGMYGFDIRITASALMVVILIEAMEISDDNEEKICVYMGEEVRGSFLFSGREKNGLGLMTKLSEAKSKRPDNSECPSW